MTRASRDDAYALLRPFLQDDEFIVANNPAYGAGGAPALARALELFTTRPELGFVWMAYDGTGAVAACVVSLAVSTAAGAVVAKLDDVTVRADKRGPGIGTAHLAALKTELRARGVARIDTSVHTGNEGARRFYERRGFVPLHEERLACVL
jgi:ribosomal protein S18 acetylase RimI-like enzyme